jgi:hypothetical protein
MLHPLAGIKGQAMVIADYVAPTVALQLREKGVAGWRRSSRNCDPLPQAEGAVAFGVVDHTLPVPEVAYLESLVPVDPDLLAMAQPLRPTEIFRFTAPCQMEACSHWSGEECKLAERVVRLVPAVTASLPRCHIRARCRWYAQVGRIACGRCPTVVTQNEAPSDAMREAATPT